MSKFLPNSFQTPNAYVDEYMHLLTSDEYKVLSYASRRIFGFQKRSDNISLSQFSEGAIYDETTGARDYGTGLNKATVRKALDTLIAYRLIEQIADNNPLENYGACYRLQLDSDSVDKAGLIARRELQAATYKTRDNVKKMNEARKQKADPVLPRSTPPPSTAQNAPVLPHRTPPFYDTGTQKTEENQKKTRESAREDNSPSALSPAVLLFQGKIKQPCSIHAMEKIDAKNVNLEIWRQVLDEWETNEYSWRNLAGIFQRYDKILSLQSTNRGSVNFKPLPPKPVETPEEKQRRLEAILKQRQRTA